MSLNFDTIDNTTNAIDEAFFAKLDECYNYLASGDPINTTENPTPTEILTLLEKVKLDTESKMEELTGDAIKMKYIYESVIR